MSSLTLMSDVTANVPIIDFGLKKKKQQVKLKTKANKKYIAASCHVELSSKQNPPIIATRGLQFILSPVIV